jgi:hypothetical protein
MVGKRPADDASRGEVDHRREHSTIRPISFSEYPRARRRWTSRSRRGPLESAHPFRGCALIVDVRQSGGSPRSEYPEQAVAVVKSKLLNAFGTATRVAIQTGELRMGKPTRAEVIGTLLQPEALSLPQHQYARGTTSGGDLRKGCTPPPHTFRPCW